MSLNVGLLIEETKGGKEVSQNQGRIKDQYENIVRCDGQVTDEIGEWLKSAVISKKPTEGACCCCGIQGHFQSDCPNYRQHQRFNPPRENQFNNGGRGHGRRLNQ